MNSYIVRISTEYATDHLDISSLPGTLVGQNGRGVEIMFTLGELHELVTRADYYADPSYRDELAESGRLSLHMSARKTLDQVKRAGLWDTGWSAEARQAYKEQWDNKYQYSH
jgi:hypothetical protein